MLTPPRSFTGTLIPSGLAFATLLAVTDLAAQPSSWTWSRGADQNGNDRVTDVVIDTVNGAVYSVGCYFYNGSNNLGPFNTGNNGLDPTSGSSDAFLVKSDLLGNTIWAAHMGGSDEDIAYGVALDPATGHVYVTGRTRSIWRAFNPAGLTSMGSIVSSGGSQCFVVCYAPNGDPLWQQTAGGSGSDEGRSIAVNSTGVFVHGTYNQVATFGSGPSTITTTAGSGQSTDHVFLAHFPLTGGDPTWIITATGADPKAASAIAADQDGVFLIGKFRGTINWQRAGAAGVTTVAGHPSADNVYITSVQNTGTVTWAQTIRNTSGGGPVQGNGIAVGCGSVYITGSTTNGSVFPNSWTYSPPSASVSDHLYIAALRKDSGGTQWLQTGYGPDSYTTVGHDIAVHANGSVYVSGTMQDDLVLGSASITSSDQELDIFLARFTSYGQGDWVRVTVDNEDERPLALALDEDRGIYVGGTYEDDLDLSGTATLVSNHSDEGLFLAKITDAASEYFPLNPSKWFPPAPMCLSTGAYDLSTTLIPLQRGSAESLISWANVSGQANITGAANGTGTYFYSNSSLVEVEMDTIVRAGDQFAITWRRESASSGTAFLSIDGSVDQVNWTPINTVLSTTSTSFITSYFAAPVDVRYMRIQRLNPATTALFWVDAISYRTGAKSGGTWSGPGVVGNTFEPATAGVGTHTLTYSVLLGGCMHTSTGEITVVAAPTGILNGTTNVCPGSPATFTLTTQAGNNSIWQRSTNGGALWTTFASNVATVSGPIAQNTMVRVLLSSSSCPDPVSTNLITVSSTDITGPAIPQHSPVNEIAPLNACGAQVIFPTPQAVDDCSTCDPGSVAGYTRLGVFNGHAYYLSDNTSDWPTANTASTATGGHLASLTSPAENAWLTGQTAGAVAYIGLNDIAVEGQFAWSNGEPVSYTNWASGQPDNGFILNQDWGVINNSGPGIWNDEGGLLYAPRKHILEFDCAVWQSAGPASASTFPIGTTTVSFSAVDLAGNLSTESFQVTVEDHQKPVFTTCPGNRTIHVDQDCAAVVPDLIGSVMATDNCAPTTYEQFPAVNTPITADTQAYVVARDPHGNTDTCRVWLDIQDQSPPTLLQCPSNIIEQAPLAQIDLVVSYVPPTAQDNCGIIWTGQTDGTGYTSGSSFPIGTTPQAWIFRDAEGLDVECSFTVTVLNNDAPQVQCPDNTTLYVSSGQCDIPYSYTQPTATDVQDAVAPTVQQIGGGAMPGPFPVGVHQQVWRAIDLDGNSSTCSFTITVLDTISPAITCADDIVIDLPASSCDTTVNHGDPVVSDNCSACTAHPGLAAYTEIGSLEGHRYFISPGDGTYDQARADAAAMGHHLVSINSAAENQFLADALNASGLADAWTGLTDETHEGLFLWTSGAPVTTAHWGSGQPDDQGGMEDATILDNSGAWYDVTTTGSHPYIIELNCHPLDLVRLSGPPSGSSLSVGIHPVTYRVTDAGGRSASCTFTIKVNDVTPPALDCPGDTILYTAQASCSANAGGLLAVIGGSDLCSAVSGISQTSGADINTPLAPDTYPLTFSATDAALNQGSCSFQLTVEDNTAPVITGCPVDTVRIDADALCGNLLPDLTTGMSAWDNCSGAVPLIQSPNASEPLTLGASVATIQAVDAHGLTSTCTVNIELIDVTPPVLDCDMPAHDTLYVGASCEAVMPTYLPIATDGCSTPVVWLHSASPVPGEALAMATYQIKFKAVDEAGNENGCVFEFAVVDSTPPTILQQQDTTITLAATDCSHLFAFPPLTGTDGACGPANFIQGTLTLNLNSSPVGPIDVTNTSDYDLPIGTHLVEEVWGDASGNTNTSSYHVTIADLSSPTITCPDTVEVYSDGDCQHFTPDLVALITASDNCLVDTLTSHDPELPLLADVTATVKVIDVGGNAASCPIYLDLIDISPPSVYCPLMDTVMVPLGPGCSLPFPDLTDSLFVLDNCTGWHITMWPPADTVFTQDTVLYMTMWVYDDNGNGLWNNHWVHVKDTTPPSAICTPVTVSLDASGTGTITPAMVDGGSGDGCTAGAQLIYTVDPSTIACTDFSSRVLYKNNFDADRNGSFPTDEQTAAGALDVSVQGANGGSFNEYWTYPAASPDRALTVYRSAMGNSARWAIELTNPTTRTLTELDLTYDLEIPYVRYNNATARSAQLLWYVDPDGSGSAPFGSAVASSPKLTNAQVTSAADAQRWLTDAEMDVNGLSARGLTHSIPVNLPPGQSIYLAFGRMTGGTADERNMNFGVDNLTVKAAGLSSVSLTVEDAAGNTASCTSPLTVLDVTLPTITCPPNLTVAATSQCTATGVPLGTPVTTDACGIFNVVHNAPSAFPLGTNTVTWTVTDMTGNIATCAQSILVTDVPPPTITASGPLVFCQGGSVTLTSSGTSGLLWSNGATTQSITVTTPGTYTVSVINPSGCTATSAPVEVVVQPLPPAPLITASGPTTFCSGGSVDLTSSAASSYLWSNGATSQSIHVTDAGAYSVTVADANGCVSPSPAISIAVNTPATASVSYPASTYCTSGSLVTPTIGGTATGLFHATPAIPTLNTATGAFNAGGTFPGTYTITYAWSGNGGCPADSIQTPIQVITSVWSGQNGSISLCTASTFFDLDSLVGDGATTGGIWKKSSGITIPNGTVNPSLAVPGTYTYWYITTGTSPCVNDTAFFSITYLGADTDSDGTPDCADNCPNVAGQIGSACDDGNTCTDNDVLNSSCVCVGTPNTTDSDSDGTPDCADNCPNVDGQIGSACDDGNACTDNDVLNSSCVCVGTPNNTDSDSDGTPDCVDNCPNAAGQIGSACDDGNACTDNDALNASCVCVGTPNNNDSDSDGTPDCADNCPNVDGQIGSACDDGNTCTDNDVLNASCVCVGTPNNNDSDSDGTPDCADNCPNVAGQIGSACDDGNTCTDNDVLNTSCICVGTPNNTDSDSDGTPDCVDNCPNAAGQIGGACDDGNACTDNDALNASCVCVGTPNNNDSDSDGTPDCADNCPNVDGQIGSACDDGNTCTDNDVLNASCVCVGTPNNTDSDSDGIPDCADNCLNVAGQQGSACDDGNTCTDNDVLNSSCVCVGTPNNTDSDSDGTPDCADNCPNVDGQIGSACDDGNTCTDNDVLNSSCVCVGTPNNNDSDSDGTPDCADNCPNLTGQIGSTCDDGNACTDNDVLNASCVCVGTPNNNDSDSDGTPDCADNCPNLTGQIGSTCDDGNACTDNDVLNASCVCVGTPNNTDSDSDGTPDCADNCPNLAGQIGSACDDGNACTDNDVLNISCVCVGTPNNTDSDSDGTSDCADNCPNLAGQIGSTCDDGNTCTDNDVLNGSCVCVGTPNNIDSDSDGTPDCVDNCPNVAGQIGSTCDDGNACTDNDVLNASCVCVGTPNNNDSDSDGTPDCADNCPNLTGQIGSTCDDGNTCTDNDVLNASCVCIGTPNNTDSDSDGTPDCADNCPNLAGQIGSACDDGNACTDNDVLNISCVCVGTPNNTDSDSDGTPDCADNCPNVDGQIGSACDDANACTDNDVLNSSCACVGTPNNTDSDSDSTPDCADNCPNVAGQIGSACDDGNACTDNDVLNATCQCAGTPNDDDNDWDGLPDCVDTCPSVSGEIGDACIDGNACTENDMLNASCQCVGTPNTTDTDGDGVPDCADNCPNVAGQQGSACDDGNALTINDAINSDCVCAGTPVACTVNGDCDDNNACTTDACVSNACVYTPITTDSDSDATPDCADNCPNVAGQQGSACDDGNTCTDNDVLNSSCVCVGTPNNTDSDSDGIPDCADNCPNLAGQIGSTCDDGNACTDNDVLNASCVCVGTLNNTDSDSDGTPDCADNCPNVAGQIGSSCDDGNACTDNDVLNASCVCVGTPNNTDSDSDGTPDCADNCPNVDGQIGSACDDGNTCTDNDVLNASCGCVGTPNNTDSDSDGTPDCADNCPNLAGQIGSACDDGNACTDNDVLNASCVCVGTPNNTDSDSDGTPDCADNCPNVAGQQGSACDDGNACTDNDVLNASCVCVGTPNNTDSDSDGTPDCADNCPNVAGQQGSACDDGNACTDNDVLNASCACVGTPNNTDSDSDGTPDCADNCPNVAGQQGSACDDGNACTDNDVLNASCVCVGALNTTDSDSDGTPDCTDNCPNAAGQIGSACDDGNALTINDAINIDCLCAGTPVACTVNGDCDDNNACTTDACVSNTCANTPITTDSDSDGTPDCTDNCPNVAGQIGSACDDGNACTDNDVLNSSCACVGTPNNTDSDSDGTPDCADNCPNLAGQIGSACDDANACTDNDVLNASCVCVGTPNNTDSDSDGTPDCADNCPNLAGQIGSTCDDGNACTDNDVLNASCVCVGTPNNTDSDSDGTPDCADNCPNVDGQIGSACDDGNTCTDNDVLNASCVCVGTPNNTDSDSDGTPDCADNCPNLAGQIGSGCDDGNACTDSDALNASCVCVGTLNNTDSDSDGTPDCADNCPNLAGQIGSACDDGNTCTDNDVLNASCVCVGTPNNTDSDSDGTPDCADNCPNVAGQIGSACDDGNALTINDAINSDCVCAGTPVACTVNGDCDDNNACTTDACVSNTCANTPITTDSDSDGTPDCADNCPNLAGQIGSACDDGNALTINDAINSDCVCAGTPVACTVNGDCDDNNACTTDACVSNTCANTPITTDSDSDGTPDCADNCPNVAGQIGSTCDDGNACTDNDVLNSSCVCVGTPNNTDSDSDGTPDCADNCPNVAGQIGSACDDGNACTENDVLNASCVCVGTPNNTDSDNDGTPDCADNCPNVAGQIGSACDDGNTCTDNDVLNASCVCVGTPNNNDSDSDGTPDCADNCPNVAGQIGSTCDDGNACTDNDVLNSSCVCVGTPNNTDSDSDGTPDCADNCPNLTGQIGSVCDDGNALTINDAINSDCVCAGTPVACTVNGDCDDNNACTTDACVSNACVSTLVEDSDGDGACDSTDGCPEDPNKTIPGDCGCGNPEPGDSCDDGNDNTTGDVWTDQCACAGTPTNFDCLGVSGGTAQPGTSCDDGNPETDEDTWTNACVCEGTTPNIDCLGINGGTAWPGTPCDDGSEATENDVYRSDCTCAGDVICVPPTILSTTSSGPICAGSSLELEVIATGTPDLTYAWSGAGTFVPDAASAQLTVSNAAGTSYAVIVSNACGSATATVLVQIDPLPTAGNDNALEVAAGTLVNLNLLLSVDSTGGSFNGPSIVVASGSTTYPFVVGAGGNCGTDTALITVTGIVASTAGADVLVHLCASSTLVDLSNYLNGADPGGSWSNSENQPVTMPVPVGGDTFFTYHVGSDTAMITLDIAPLPDAGTSTSVVVCLNDAPVEMLTLLGGAAGGTWTGPDLVVSELFDPSTMSGGTYIYTVSDSCGSDADTVLVTVNPMADATWNAPAVICANGGPIDLNALVTGETGGSWTGELTGSLFDPSGLSGAYTFTYTVGTGACASSVQHTIHVDQGPMADAGPDDQVCALSYSLQAVIDVVTGTWSSPMQPGIVAFDHVNDPNALATVPSPGAYPLVWTVGDGQCYASDTVVITFNDPGLPLWAEAGDDQEIDVFTTTVLNGTVSTGASATWSVISGGGIFSDINDTNATITGLAVGENILVLNAASGEQCGNASDTVRITVNDIFIPQGYSPNGDGVNDQFRITGIQAFPGNELKIFNRWGQEVLGRKGYANDWAGKGDNGQALPDDTYFYVLNLTPERTYNGFVIIKR